ncbi:MAG: TonB-dependent receptor [Candidatus Lernaella stagnicola]|nr:TonB-dependent receptor [Candidatus Lernaella stagnicola]
MRRGVFWLVILLALWPALGWAGTLRGVVTDQDGTVVFGCQITVRETKRTAYSGEDGSYVFDNLPAGSYTLEFFTEGYEKTRRRVTVPGDGAVVADAELSFGVEFEEKEIVVTDKAPIDQSPQTSAHTFEREEIEDNAGAFEDITKAIQQLPGIVASTDFTSDMYVRGSENYENLIVIDGQLLSNPYHFGIGLSIIDTDLVERFTFYAAGFPAQYPFATGSVLDVTYRDGNRDHVDAVADVSLLSASALVSGPAGDKMTWIINARRSYYDYMLRALDWTDVPIPVFSDVMLRGSFYPNDKHRFVALLIRSEDGAEAALEENPSTIDEGEGYYNQITQMYGLSYNFLPTSWFLYKTSLSYQIVTADGNLTSDTDTFFGRAQINGMYVNNEVQFDLGRNVFKSGAVYGRVDLDIGARFPLSQFVPGARFANEQEQFTIEFGDQDPKQLWGGYVQHETEVVPQRLRTNIGVRVDHYMATQNGWVVSPRAALAVNLARQTVLKTAWGIYYLPPYSSFITDTDIGNPNLRSQKSTHYVVGLEQGLGGQMVLRVESYYKELDDLIFMEIGGSDEGGLQQSQFLLEGRLPTINYFNSGSGRALGVEVFFQKKLGGWWDGWLAYTLGEVRYNDGRGEYGSYYPQQDQRHTLNLVANFRPLTDWVFSSTFRLASGRPYTPVNDWVETFPGTFFRYWQAQNGALNEARFPLYHRLDMRVERTWHVHPRVDLTVFSEVYNVYNQRNLWGYYYEAEEGLDKPKRVPIYQLPVIPFAGVKAEFL